MTALERLLAEAIPDGSFGGARTPSPAPAASPPLPRRETTPAEAAAHYERLDAACREIAGRPAARRSAAKSARHLHAVPGHAAPTRKAS